MLQMRTKMRPTTGRESIKNSSSSDSSITCRVVLGVSHFRAPDGKID